MKNIYFIVIFFLSFPFNLISQDDFLENDSIPFEEFRNYLGSNISPLLMGVVSGKDNFNVKVNLSYKRNFRDKNLRFSLNYLTEGNTLLYDYFIPVSTTDSTLTNRYFNNSFEHYDFRFGFEELRGYNGTRIHVGVDAILGYGTNNSTYFDRKFNLIDSSGNYMLDTLRDNPSLFEGNHNANYLVTGIDVSFGIDWMLNENFMFTFQVTPQFNYYIFLDEKILDTHGEYIGAKNYADFRLGYFDLILYYRF
jgi:hypothetical protein